MGHVQRLCDTMRDCCLKHQIQCRTILVQPDTSPTQVEGPTRFLCRWCMFHIRPIHILILGFNFTESSELRVQQQTCTFSRKHTHTHPHTHKLQLSGVNLDVKQTALVFSSGCMYFVCTAKTVIVRKAVKFCAILSFCR